MINMEIIKIDKVYIELCIDDYIIRAVISPLIKNCAVRENEHY